MSLNSCPNCQRAITCGCQKRTASDGKQVCTVCLNEYEVAIANKRAQVEK